ncbi:HYC_CC_PP family protein [Galbibacter mesophilus]|uniref:HYC_CC_PP family protein n=1 Tax=Galbibacter mesophilus TaxID=379069 RepID=UPI00191D3125|nr:hypothetical protein [Galbibacter mesophilus]MCM5662758.1 hypothetical protein [Galbibacter mesophilus]
MKRVFQKIVSVVMALVVMFTTMSFTLDLHYCGDALVDYSFFTKPESCGMDKVLPATNCENTTMSKKSCCSDQKIVKEGQDDLKTAFNTLTFEQHTFVAVFFYTYKNLFEGFDKNFIPYQDYSPPFIERDVQTLYETYLI